MTASQKTFCRICEAHCGLLVEKDAQGNIVKLRPDSEHPISDGFVCAKGLRFLDIANHPERLLDPQIRQPDGALKAATWDDAYTLIGDQLQTIIAEHGVHSVAIYFGTTMIHHSLLLLTLYQWVRRLGTRNVYSAASQDNSSKLAAQKLIHGYELRVPIMDIAHADFALLLGTNPVISQGTFVHVEGGTKAYDAFRKRGGQMVIVDPRRTESAQRWGKHLPIKPATDIFLLLALLDELRDLTPPDAVQGLDELLALARDYPVDTAATLTGIPAAEIRQLAQQLRTAERATIFNGVGVNQSPFGMLSVILIQAIAYVTGNFDQRGGLLFQSWTHLLKWLVGTQSQTSRIGGYQSHAGGLPCGILGDEILTAGDGQIKALIVIAGNPLTSAPDENKLRRAFQQLDLLVSIDLFENQTGKLAHVLLPGITWLERFDIGGWDAAYETAPILQSTGRVRRPPANTRSEVRILSEISMAAGKPLLWSQLLTQLWARTAWDRVLPVLLKPLQILFRKGDYGIPWKRVRPNVYRGRYKQRLRFWGEELTGEPERLANFAAQLQATLAIDEFFLIGRRRRLAQNSWVHQAGRIEKDKESCAWLCADDMARLSLDDGDIITIASEVATITLPVRTHDGVMPSTVVVPHGLPDVNVNRLIASTPHYIEPASGMHQMVGHRVRISKAE